MLVTPVPCLRDNYAYIVQRDGGSDALVVDPSESEPVARALEAAGLHLAGILNTHHHFDHVGGNEELVQRFGRVPVYGHASDKGRIPLQSEFLEHDGEIEAAGLHFRVLHIPGHTLGAIAYVGEGGVFTGDTLFGAGCGRLFEGTPVLMYESLNTKLGALPDTTRVYFGHEYTENNLRFAAHVEPGNAAVTARLASVRAARAESRPTTPSTLAEERATNPFMRCSSPEIIERVSARLSAARDPVAVLAAVRAEKDAF